MPELNLFENKVNLLILTLIIGLFYLIKTVYFNPTISETRGYYFTYKSSDYKVGERVLVCILNPKNVLTMHKLQLPYVSDACPYNTPYLLKTIVAKTGDQVIISKDGIWVNSKLFPNSVGLIRFKQIALNPLAHGKFILGSDQYFLLGDTPHSYDSRYFGIIRKEQIYRKAILVWPTSSM